MRRVILFVGLLFLAVSLGAQTPETESNDLISDANVITISAAGQYTGDVIGAGGGSPDVDYWKIVAGSSSINLNLLETSASVTIQLQAFTDAGYTSYEGVITSWVGGDDPAIRALDNAKYYALFVATESATSLGYILDVEEDSSLPVGLVSFSAQETAEGVLVEWVTESETDHLGFILDRSSEGVAWTAIASYLTQEELEGQGNVSTRTEYAWVDDDVVAGQTYFYRLSDVGTGGGVHVYPAISIVFQGAPDETAMDNAFPNPFNPETYIAYKLAEPAQVVISVFDLKGRLVRTIRSGEQFAGSYHVYWNGRNDDGVEVPSGSYILRMQTEKVSQIQKVIYLK